MISSRLSNDIGTREGRSLESERPRSKARPFCKTTVRVVSLEFDAILLQATFVQPRCDAARVVQPQVAHRRLLIVE